MADPELRLQSRVRNSVWMAVFAAGGAENFLARLNAFAPALVLFAPTAKLRMPVSDFFDNAGTDWPWLFADRHPSGWWTPPRLINSEAFRHKPEPLSVEHSGPYLPEEQAAGMESTETDS